MIRKVRFLKWVAEALTRAAVRMESQGCTGVSASWCPIHGDCCCPPNCPECGSLNTRPGDGIPLFKCDDCEHVFLDDGSRSERSSDQCPLHSAWSTHAEGWL